MLRSWCDELCVLPAMQCHCILPAGQLQPHWGTERRLAMAFAPHPRQLLLGVGASLLRCSIGAPGQHQPQLAVLHTSGDCTSFMALATAEQVSSLFHAVAVILSNWCWRRCGADSCVVQECNSGIAHTWAPVRGTQPGADRTAANLLAALTERHVLLFDVRRPAQALLQWPHGLGAARPEMLSLFCHPGADEVTDLGPHSTACSGRA